jgi:hypothetical protein
VRETQLETTPGTQNARLMEVFRARPGQWIPMPELAQAINAYAVHSRVADLRKLGWTIRNRQRQPERPGPRLSSYCYVPQSAA